MWNFQKLHGKLPFLEKHLLDLFDVTIFVHAYDVSGYHSQNGDDNLYATDLSNLINTIKPKKFLIESYLYKIEDFRKQVKTQCLRRGSSRPEYIKSQLYSIYMVNQLKKLDEKENNFIYDIAIKIRFDTIFYSNFSVMDIDLIKKYENIILCGNPDIKTMLYKTGCKNCIKNFEIKKYVKCLKHTDISDIVIMSTSKIMNFYAKIYLAYDTFVIDNHKKVKCKQLCNYIKHVYDNGSILYYDVPNTVYLYPEKVLAEYLKDYILLNYTMKLDINRNVVSKWTNVHYNRYF